MQQLILKDYQEDLTIFQHKNTTNKSDLVLIKISLAKGVCQITSFIEIYTEEHENQ